MILYFLERLATLNDLDLDLAILIEGVRTKILLSATDLKIEIFTPDLGKEFPHLFIAYQGT